MAAKGSSSKHGTSKAVYPKVKASGTRIGMKKVSTRGSGLKQRKTKG